MIKIVRMLFEAAVLAAAIYVVLWMVLAAGQALAPPDDAPRWVRPPAAQSETAR